MSIIFMYILLYYKNLLNLYTCCPRIGMLEPDCYPTVERCKANKLKLTKYEVQEKFQLEYLAALEKEKEDVIIILINYLIFIDK